MSAQQITVAGPVSAPQIAIVPEALEARRMALDLAKSVSQVTDAGTQRQAAEALATVKGLVRQVEDARKAVKQPVLDAGRKIDGIAKDFCGDLEAEAKRLSMLVGSYQEKERAKREEAERAAREREAAIMADLAAKEAVAKDGEVEALRDEAVDAIVEARQEAANAYVPQSDGTMIRKTWKFEVTDIQSLYAAHPELCVISPNNAAIRAVIKNRQDIPGLRVWSETAAVVRSSAPVALPVDAASYDY